MDDIEFLHEKILYPVVRVRSRSAGGSGVLVYSKPDPKHTSEHINIVLTCEHVIDEAIQLREEFDPVLKRERKIDYFEEVTVELFDYIGSKLISANATKSSIIAYDKRHDIAALKLNNPLPQNHVATLIGKDDIPNLRLFESVYTAGCSLSHDPFANPGTLTYLRQMIDQKAYLMANAPAVFGNSGGGLFRGDDGALLGLTSRVTTIDLGFSIDILTWMAFSTHPQRLYEFFDYHELQFIYDDKDDYYSAQERREKRRKEAMRSILLGEGTKQRASEFG